MSPAPRPGPQISPVVLERIAIACLLLLAFVPRVRDLGGGFDRGFEGYQGSFHAIAAANYERLGVGAAGGYPVLNIDLPESNSDWFVYANHSPVTPLLAWSALRTMGPPGWAQGWSAGETVDGVEAPMRFPFLLVHMAGLLLLWWVARVAFGTQVALIALALVSSLPVSALYGTLVNVETLSVPGMLLAVGSYGLFARDGGRRWLLVMGLGFLAGCAVTYGPAFVLPVLCLRSLWKRKVREALAVGGVGAVACGTPILVQGWWAASALTELGQAPLSIGSRAAELLAPLLSGEVPFLQWGSAQVAHTLRAQGPLLVVVAGVGALLCLLRGWSPRRDERLAQFEWPANPRANVDLATPLFLGAMLYFFAFYRHTAEEQWSFQLYLVPAVCLFAARAIHSISLPLQRLRGGIAPLVLCTGSVLLPGLARFESWRALERSPGPRDVEAIGDPSRSPRRGPEAPLPQTAGRQLRTLLPPGAVGFHPASLGLTPATAWYAQRSLFPIQGPEDPAMGLVLEATGLEEVPAFIVLPKDPPDSAREGIEALREALAREPASLETAHWAAWER